MRLTLAFAEGFIVRIAMMQDPKYIEYLAQSRHEIYIYFMLLGFVIMIGFMTYIFVMWLKHESI